jgi:hypothetical protein
MPAWAVLAAAALTLPVPPTGTGSVAAPDCGTVLVVFALGDAGGERVLAATFTGATCALLPAQGYTRATWEPEQGGCWAAAAPPGALCLTQPYVHGQGIVHYELEVCGLMPLEPERCLQGRASVNG